MPLELPYICSTEQRIESPTQETPEEEKVPEQALSARGKEEKAARG